MPTAAKATTPSTKPPAIVPALLDFDDDAAALIAPADDVAGFPKSEGFVVVEPLDEEGFGVCVAILREVYVHTAVAPRFPVRRRGRKIGVEKPE